MKPRVLMAVSPEHRKEIFSEDALHKLASFASASYHPGPGDMAVEDLARSISCFDGLITCWGSPPITPEIMGKARRLRIISHSAGSVRSFVCEEVFSRGICVTNASSAIAVSVAEATIALIIGSLRHLFEYDDHLRNLREGKPDFGVSHELTGRTVGIVGMGEVGRKVIAFLKPFSCRILVHDPYKSKAEIEEAGGFPAALEDLMAQSDVVSIHAPNIPANRHMISRGLLARLRDGALLVNTARGELIDEDSLIREARSGRIRCALDVFEADAREVAGKLREASNVILTPHIAGKAVETRRRQGDVVVEDMRLFFSGGTPRNLVSREMMEWMA
jgi:phosphoglycerate dehydrogenase-like enzyme